MGKGTLSKKLYKSATSLATLLFYQKLPRSLEEICFPTRASHSLVLFQLGARKVLFLASLKSFILMIMNGLNAMKQEHLQCTSDSLSQSEPQ